MSFIDNNSEKSKESSVSPEAPAKRRRVNHDYRRLSSSGFVDDYEKGRDRFINASDKEDPHSPPKVPLKNPTKQSKSIETNSTAHESSNMNTAGKFFFCDIILNISYLEIHTSNFCLLIFFKLF